MVWKFTCKSTSTTPGRKGAAACRPLPAEAGYTIQGTFCRLFKHQMARQDAGFPRCVDVDGSVDLGDDASLDLDLAPIKDEADDETSVFDAIVGVLQSALLSIRPEVESFCLSNCDVFEPSAENKLSYMDVYTRYSRLIEDHLESSLKGEEHGVDFANGYALDFGRGDDPIAHNLLRSSLPLQLHCQAHL